MAISASLVLSLICGNRPAAGDSVDLAAAAAALAASYPGLIAKAAGDAVEWHDGSITRLGEIRNPASIGAIMAKASLGEQFIFEYPLYPWSASHLPIEDPGRIRNQDFFVKMYGDCRRGGVRRRLRNVVWLPHVARQVVQVTSVNGIDRVIEKIYAEIEALPRNTRSAAIRLSGTYACRKIAGTHQLSMHAYGAAVDLRAGLGSYWRWSGMSPSARARQSVPHEIIQIFEQNGFIWGGKWLHVDGMHFEYRPELIYYARRREKSRTDPKQTIGPAE